MTAKTINPVLKQALELGPAILFFAIYMLIKDRNFVVFGTDYSGFIIATIVFLPILLASIATLWVLTGELSRMQIFTGVVAVFFGGLTAWFNDASFFKMKTTLVYGSFALLLGIGLLRGQSWLQWVLGAALPMQQEGWMILTRRLLVVFVLLAIANELIWRNMSDATWVTLETFVFPAVLFAFLMVQISMLGRFMIEPEARDDEAQNHAQDKAKDSQG
ncbi:septation protein IspZ [Xinfangfangia sp. D13-10-4-6]|uniref:inner membrane-spanning protein YciB n=1 Tax=Pseudogemmobacter hezensis TaxID=2737662 RepID=UPI001554AB2F|nr:inner membrane-spanning protein YciB [Pseudogemmobacter hezensis]NPD16909.1 septation protein IspZ [Pseudogemmobacter hezensis]